MQKKCLKNVVFLTFALCFLIATGVQAELITIPLENPGAETGDMTGWDSADFEAQADDGWTSHHSGNYHFENRNSNQIATLIYGHRFTMTQQVDLSDYAGRIEDIRVRAWANSDVEPVIDYFDDSEYVPVASVGHFFYDADGNYIWGITNGEVTNDGWTEVKMSSSGHTKFDDNKDNIYSIEVELKYWLPAPYGSGHYLEWENGPPEFLAFDDARLEIEVSPVPLPPALLLFGSGIGALVLRRKNS